ncbi:MAG: M20 family metallopeptidase [bacterium]|nr:M20 family metallopeptidase [bacterium]
MLEQSKAVLEYVERHRDDLVTLLQTMIRTRSVNPAFDPASPGEAAMARLVADRYAALGIATDIVEAVPGRPNVVATWKGSIGRPRLLVNCHLDTVPPDCGEWVDPHDGKVTSGWTKDPFGGEIVDGRIYGRGAADHKSPIAATLMALEALVASSCRLEGDLVCIHDADEEVGGRYGMRYLAEHMPFDFDMALYACTGDVTPLGSEYFSALGTNNIIRTLAGTQTYQIRLTGHNLHSMAPLRHLGAAEAAVALIDRLGPLMQRVNDYQDPVDGSGHPAMRISGIDSGERVAVHHQSRTCEITVNRKIHQSIDPEAALAEIKAVVAAHNAAYPENTASLEVLRNLPPAITPADHPVVTGLARAVKAVLGEEARVTGMPCPVGISSFLATVPIPTVLFGYGLVNLHHAHDEYIAADDLVKMAKVYAVAFMEWLGRSE